jgi:hypothetical protein
MQANQAVRAFAMASAFAFVSGVALTGAPDASAAPTDGWSQSSWSYSIHKPYNLSLSSRFKYTGGVWYTWVYKTDMCFQSTCSSTDGKRTELRWNNNYTSGRHMWDGDIWLVSGTHEATVIQVFGGATSATASQVRGFTDSSGTYKRYGSEVLATSVNNKWTNIKASHDAGAGTVSYYVNNTLKRTDPDRGDNTHYFKNGVYVGTISSTRSETRYRNLKYWKR